MWPGERIVIVLEEMRVLLIVMEEVDIGSRVSKLHLAVGLLVLELVKVEIIPKSVSCYFLVK